VQRRSKKEDTGWVYFAFGGKSAIGRSDEIDIWEKLS